MDPVKDNYILAVIERTEGSSEPDLNYITTEYTFFNDHSDPNFDPEPAAESSRHLEHQMRCALNDELLPREFRYQKDENSPIKMYSILRFQLNDPAGAASNLSKFVNGVWNDFNEPNYEIVLDKCSIGAIRSLSNLLTPYQRAGSAQRSMPLGSDYLNVRDSALSRDLENVLGANGFGLLTVERKRLSVTQGFADVKANGNSIVSFGDEIWLQCKNGKLSNGFREIDAVPMYEVSPTGYGSINADDLLIRAAIVQFPERIASELKSYGRDKFMEMLNSASLRTESSSYSTPSTERGIDL